MQTVFDIPGAVCANPLDTYAAVTPQGEFKNEVFYYNATDSTLRVSHARVSLCGMVSSTLRDPFQTRCSHCLGACVTMAAPALATTSPDVISAQYARTRFMEAVQASVTVGPGVGATYCFLL